MSDALACTLLTADTRTIIELKLGQLPTLHMHRCPCLCSMPPHHQHAPKRSRSFTCLPPRSSDSSETSAIHLSECTCRPYLHRPSSEPTMYMMDIKGISQPEQLGQHRQGRQQPQHLSSKVKKQHDKHEPSSQATVHTGQITQSTKGSWRQSHQTNVHCSTMANNGTMCSSLKHISGIQISTTYINSIQRQAEANINSNSSRRTTSPQLMREYIESQPQETSNHITRISHEGRQQHSNRSSMDASSQQSDNDWSCCDPSYSTQMPMSISSGCATSSDCDSISSASGVNCNRRRLSIQSSPSSHPGLDVANLILSLSILPGMSTANI